MAHFLSNQEETCTWSVHLASLLVDNIFKHAPFLEPDEAFLAEYKSQLFQTTLQSRAMFVDQLYKAVSSNLGRSSVDLTSWVLLCRKAGIIGKDLSTSKVSFVFLEVLEVKSKYLEPQSVCANCLPIFVHLGHVLPTMHTNQQRNGNLFKIVVRLFDITLALCVQVAYLHVRFVGVWATCAESRSQGRHLYHL
jgi:hypothetical protein